MKRKAARRSSAGLLWGLLIILAGFVLFPLMFTMSASFMNSGEVRQSFGSITLTDGFTPLHLIPDRISLSGYTELLIQTPQILMRFWISLGICAAIAAGQTVLSILGGYAFSKFRFPFRDGIFFGIIILMLLPYQVTLVPGYMVMKALGLLNTNASLILPGVFSAFGIFLMRQVMAAVPDSLLEAAKLDGANSFAALWRVMVPSCSSGLAALITLSFVDAWNMVEQPIVYLQDMFRYPLSVFLLSVNEHNMTLGFACGVLSILPVLLLLLRFEKQLVEGMGYSVIK